MARRAIGLTTAQIQWRLWVQYLLDKANGDETEAAGKLTVLIEKQWEADDGQDRIPDAANTRSLRRR